MQALANAWGTLEQNWCLSGWSREYCSDGLYVPIALIRQTNPRLHLEIACLGESLSVLLRLCFNGYDAVRRPVVNRGKGDWYKLTAKDERHLLHIKETGVKQQKLFVAVFLALNRSMRKLSWFLKIDHIDWAALVNEFNDLGLSSEDLDDSFKSHFKILESGLAQSPIVIEPDIITIDPVYTRETILNLMWSLAAYGSGL